MLHYTIAPNLHEQYNNKLQAIIYYKQFDILIKKLFKVFLTLKKME